MGIVANSRSIRASEFASDAEILVIDGDIPAASTADRLVSAAIERFGRIDTLVNNAGVFIPKPRRTNGETSSHDFDCSDCCSLRIRQLCSNRGRGARASRRRTAHEPATPGEDHCRSSLGRATFSRHGLYPISGRESPDRTGVWSWHWADTSGEPLILVGLPAGPHKVQIILADANHQPLDKAVVEFVVPAVDATSGHH